MQVSSDYVSAKHPSSGHPHACLVSPSLPGAGPLGNSVFPLVHAIFRVDGSWLPRFTLTRETAKLGPDLLTHRN